MDRYILIYIDALSASLLICAARKSTCFTRLAYNTRHKGFRNKGRIPPSVPVNWCHERKLYLPSIHVSLCCARRIKQYGPGKCSYALSGILMKVLGKSGSELQNFSLIFRESRKFELRNHFRIILMNINSAFFF